MVSKILIGNKAIFCEVVLFCAFVFGTMGKNFVSGTASDQNQRMNSRYLPDVSDGVYGAGAGLLFLSCENGEGKRE